MTIETDLQTLEPGAIVDLYKLDATAIGGDVVYFHRHTQIGSIWWQGIEYTPWPIQSEGFERTSDRPPAPKLAIANVDGSISALCLQFEDLIGSILTRHRTLGKYLDAVNFDGVNIVSNGTFDDGTNGWSPQNATLAAVNGTLEVTATTTSGQHALQVPTCVVGRTYRITGRTRAGIGGRSRVSVSNGAEYLHFGVNSTTTFVNFSGTFTANVVNPQLQLTVADLGAWGAIGDTAYYDDISIREVIGNPDADPTEQLPPEIWYISRKAMEDNKVVQFELASGMDLEGIKLPRRQIIANYCSAMSIGGYRGPLCGYTGPPVATADDTPTSDPALDKCGGKLSSCKLRQWPDGVLNFNGFPAAGLMRI